MRYMISLWALWCALGPYATAADLDVTLRVEKTTYKVGETLSVEIRFKNTTSHAIKLLPEPRALEANMLTIKDAHGKRTGTVVPFGETSTDFEAWSKEVILLHAMQEHSVKYGIKVAASLPASYDDKRTGLFLWFSGSNILLPGFGKYSAEVEYECGPHHPVRRYISGDVPLWQGKVRSNAVLLEFRSK